MTTSRFVTVVAAFVALSSWAAGTAHAQGCGNGNRGDGTCPGTGQCCSIWGWCGMGVAYCGISANPTPVPPPPSPPANPVPPSPSVPATATTRSRCGSSWTDAVASCRNECTTNNDCEGGTYCFGWITCSPASNPSPPKASPANPAPTPAPVWQPAQPSGGVVTTQSRCGSSWANAGERCGPSCYSDLDCQPGQWCYGWITCTSTSNQAPPVPTLKPTPFPVWQPPTTPSNPTPPTSKPTPFPVWQPTPVAGNPSAPTAPSQSGVLVSTTQNRCGRSWPHALQTCPTASCMYNYECPPDQYCWGWVSCAPTSSTPVSASPPTPVSASPPAVPPSPTKRPTRKPTPVSTPGSPAYVTWHYYSAGQSTNTVSCSDGANGLQQTMGYPTLSPLFPYVAATSVSGWNSPNCGNCYRLESGGNVVYVTAIDQTVPGPDNMMHFDMAPAAFAELMGGTDVGVGTISYTEVDPSNCQGNTRSTGSGFGGGSSGGGGGGGGGSCGNGNRGDGTCPNGGNCCSAWGYCGSGPSYCIVNANAVMSRYNHTGPHYEAEPADSLSAVETGESLAEDSPTGESLAEDSPTGEGTDDTSTPFLPETSSAHSIFVLKTLSTIVGILVVSHLFQ